MPSTGKQIDLSYARQLVKNYEDTKIGRVLPEDETIAVWFSKETILSALGLPPETDTKDISGIRFYLGAYREEPDHPENPADRNKITIVTVSTGQQSIIVNRGDVSEKAYLDLITEPDPASPAEPAYPKSGSAPVLNNLIFNEAQICPPPAKAFGLGLMIP